MTCECGYTPRPGRTDAQAASDMRKHQCTRRTCPDCGQWKTSARYRRCLPCGHRVSAQSLRERNADVDDMAVARLINGSTVRSTRGERQAAVAILTARGMSLTSIGARIGVTARTVSRLRARAL